MTFKNFFKPDIFLEAIADQMQRSGGLPAETPIIFLFAEDCYYCGIFAWANATQRKAVFMGAGTLIKKAKIKAYAIAHEVWGAPVDENDKFRHGRAENDPERMELLMLIYRDMASGNCKNISWLIERPNDKKILKRMPADDFKLNEKNPGDLYKLEAFSIPEMDLWTAKMVLRMANVNGAREDGSGHPYPDIAGMMGNAARQNPFF